MDTEIKKERKPVQVSVVTYRVHKPTNEEIRRLLGHDLIKAEQKGMKK